MAFFIRRSRIFLAKGFTNLTKRYETTAFPDNNEEFIQQWVEFFEDPKLRKAGIIRGLEHVFGYDIVPGKRIIEAAFRCCRRLNFYSPTIRIFEGLADKVEKHDDYIEIVKELEPVINELGLKTPESLGFNKLTLIPKFTEEGKKIPFTDKCYLRFPDKGY